MHGYSHPPMFTSYGYQPSIFMDTSPTLFRPDRHPDLAHAPASVAHVEGPSSGCVDYIQIWLSTHPADLSQETPPVDVPELDPMAAPSAPLMPFASQGTSANASTCDTESLHEQSESMEWMSCVSSPVLNSVPELDHRSMSPSPELAEQGPPPPAAMGPSPIAFGFQQHVMLPCLPFRGRSQCIFLVRDSSSPHTRVHRRVKELLHNVSVQRIRGWFKLTIEPCALEQWRNLSLFNHMASRANAVGERNVEPDSNEDCPICFRQCVMMKVIASCGHAVCWKCEQDLDRAGNISCPMCRRMRVTTTYKSVLDLFKSTIGLHPSDYTHAYFLPSSPENSTAPEHASHSLCPQNEDGEDEVERELSDRYLWEQSASFLEHLLKSARSHAANQYFQLNAAQDLCFKSSTDQYLPEYNDQAILEPPTSGLVLPPHRLYIALIHFCLDMLTLPNPNEFQNRPEYKHEMMLIELVTLFLVPTDVYSPRGPGRVYNAPAWIEHGQYILARIHRFLQTKVRQSINGLSGGDESEGAAVPSTPMSRQILYLGTARWTWVAQSLSVLVTWIQAANANPSMAAPVAKWSRLSLLGKRGVVQEMERRGPMKRRRLR